MTTFDYIIIGAGAAGLMLADGFGKESLFRNKSILVIDRDTKQTNDRTWCFWEKGKGDFDQLVHKSWDQIFFAGTNFKSRQPIRPYIYKMVRGIDFYREYLGRITLYPNISILKAEVLGICSSQDGVELSTNLGRYHCKMAFNSAPEYDRMVSQKKFPVLQQHFLGWFVKTEKPTFDDRTTTFMDFSIPQKGNTRFMYVLPFSNTEALVEYTFFSKNPMTEQEYEAGLRDYMKKHLKSAGYSVSEIEKGSIPMTCYDFSSANTENLFHIGAAGGWTKASTGFTFMNTYRKTQALIRLLKKEKPLDNLYIKDRFWFYDLLLLDILYCDNAKGQPIFESLFKKRSPQMIFKFLDGNTNLWEDLMIISACPKREFIKALLKRIF
ncbi:lycopene cyclase [Flavobacteriaceae bacterium F89]|uniref:Lycopene cyclase n=1 Tax=Cerina litoralis TaxID=2874477 RepID=A0AAE3EQF9_9FLAO|nr:lycopene cyclase family protein [Cerina litoralis]MCG2459185.1 lycopene cyclase [Cerina litoralis]